MLLFGSVPIKARFGSPEFRAEYRQANTHHEPAPKLGTVHSSLRWLCEQFIKTTENSNSTTPTQHERRLRLEPVGRLLQNGRHKNIR